MKRGRVYGLVGMVLTFSCWYFYKTALASPQVAVLISNTGQNRLPLDRMKSSSVLRKLHWFDLGDSQNSTNSTSDAECREVLKQNKSERCDFVKNTDDCSVDEGFIDYTQFLYCDFKSSLIPLGFIILFIWWLFLFVGLAVTADDFFCPSLSVIAKTMRLSDNVAGVTFMAFGNGAPDIFSAIAAIGNATDGDAGLAIGALFGAGVFVTTIVAGTISIICPFTAMQRPFLRDVIFYIAAVFWTFVVLWDKKISKIEAIGFILMYIGYVLVVVIGRYIYQRTKTPVAGPEVDVLDGEVNADQGLSVNGGKKEDKHITPVKQESEKSAENKPTDSASETDRLLQSVTRFPNDEEKNSAFHEFLNAINPIDVENWREMKMYRKIFEVFKSPLVFVLLITIPVVDYEEDNHKWNRYLNSLQCFTGPLLGVIATKVGFYTLDGSFDVWALTLIIGFMLAVLVFCTSKNDQPPVYHPALAYLGFVVAVIWIYSIANEVVNILQTFGIVLNISNAVLGLTLLAWGNSIGDLIADTVMAKQGAPRMGISACFGGPLFMLGIGIPFTIGTIKKGHAYALKLTLEEVVLAAFLALSLITSLIIVPLSKFRMSRGYGITLIVLYIVFLVIALLAESDVITADVNSW